MPCDNVLTQPQTQVHCTLWFIALSSPELAISRLAERVAQGGHNIPEDVIRRRYRRTCKFI